MKEIAAWLFRCSYRATAAASILPGLPGSIPLRRPYSKSPKPIRNAQVGRQKMRLKFIENEAQRLITFRKRIERESGEVKRGERVRDRERMREREKERERRRSLRMVGLMKKALEISLLCGIDVGFVAFREGKMHVCSNTSIRDVVQ
eukprot:1027049-Amorphochlora_amoeboformis.AAC.2